MSLEENVSRLQKKSNCLCRAREPSFSFVTSNHYKCSYLLKRYSLGKTKSELWIFSYVWDSTYYLFNDK